MPKRMRVDVRVDRKRGVVSLEIYPQGGHNAAALAAGAVFMARILASAAVSLTKLASKPTARRGKKGSTR